MPPSTALKPGLSPSVQRATAAGVRAGGIIAAGIGLMLSLSALGAAAAEPAVPAYVEQQEQAVALARAGDLEAGLLALNSLLNRHPQVLPLRYDLIAVSFWAEAYAQVLSAAEQLDPAVTPTHVSAAVARSARNLGRLDLAAAWYRSALIAAPGSMDLELGLAMTLADAGAHRQARRLLNELPVEVADTDQVLLASAYLHRQDRAFVPAINDYDLVLRKTPAQPEAVQGKVAALKGLLLPDQALLLVEAHPDLFSTAEVERLEADALAVNLRHALWSPDKHYPFPAVRRALTRIDARLGQTDPHSALGRQLRYDRIIALHAMNRWVEALLEFDALIDEGATPPAYVLHTAGRIYLDLRMPERAESVLRKALAEQPADVEVQITLFYSLIDQERYDDAIELIDTLADSVEPVLRTSEDQQGKPNPAYTSVRVVAAMSRAYADQLDAAIERLEDILDEAPGNRQAQVGLAHVYRWRGWPDRAASTYRSAWSPDPLQNLEAEFGLAHAQLDQQNYDAVRSTMRRLSPPYLTYLIFDDLHRDWSQHFRSQIRFDARYGRSSGDTFGNKQYDANFWWFSYPWRLNYRAYLRTFDSWAEFPAGDYARRRIAGGVEYRKHRWRLVGELNGDRFDFDTPGGRVQAGYRASDRWLFGAEADFASYATPLRADRAGITSDRYSATVRYRRNDLWEVGGEIALQPFDDGNNVPSASLYGSYRLVNGYTYKLDVYGHSGITTSSLDDTVYFSPESAFALSGGVRNTWRQYRRYERLLIHRLSADVGLYDQQGYGSNPTWTLDYELQWQLSDRLALRGGAQLNSRYYDGGEEQTWYVRFGLEGRL